VGFKVCMVPPDQKKGRFVFVVDMGFSKCGKAFTQARKGVFISGAPRVVGVAKKNKWAAGKLRAGGDPPF